MAYVSQDLKKKIAPAIKSILKKYGIKGTLSVRNHSTLVLNIKEGKIDFIKNHIEKTGNVYVQSDRGLSINTYWYQEHFSGKALNCLKEIVSAMMLGNHNNSDIMTDYFDVGWYIDINLGKYFTPYVVTK